MPPLGELQEHLLLCQAGQALGGRQRSGREGMTWSRPLLTACVAMRDSGPTASSLSQEKRRCLSMGCSTHSSTSFDVLPGTKCLLCHMSHISHMSLMVDRALVWGFEADTNSLFVPLGPVL